MRYVLSAIAALIFAAVIVQFTGDQLEETVRTALYKVSGKSIPVYSKEHTDENGVPYVDYYELKGYTAGKQYNATIVCNYAIDYYREYIKKPDSNVHKKFFNCVGWLKNDITQRENDALFVFRWRQPWYDSVGVPFTSGMTSGLAIQVFTYAYQLSKDSTFLILNDKLVAGYFSPVEEGGFTYKAKHGWWYEELADTAMHTPFILDGHIFAVTGLHHYLALSKNDSAKIAFNRGIAALKYELPNYDAGDGTMYYDKYKLPADKKYQKLLISQMKELYELTGDPIFNQYHNKWKAPLARPYLFRVVDERNISGLILYLLFVLVLLFLFILAGKLIRQPSRTHRQPISRQR